MAGDKESQKIKRQETITFDYQIEKNAVAEIPVLHFSMAYNASCWFSLQV